VPPEFAGVRTMFLSFHHHPPERARAILRDAFDKRIGIAVFEFTARKPSLLLANLLLVPVAVLFITPTIRPLKLSQTALHLPTSPGSNFHVMGRSIRPNRITSGVAFPSRTAPRE